MGYDLVVAPSAERDLKKLERREVFLEVAAAIQGLSDAPRPDGAAKLVSRPGWRIRIGDYRVIYDIDDKVRVVSIVRVRHRSDVYR